MHSKGQTGLEFLVISGVALFLLTSFFIVINLGVEEKQKERELLLMKGIGFSIADEIKIAFESSEGYSREFNVPEKINGKDYEIVKLEHNTTIYLYTENNFASFSIKEIQGKIEKGVNKIEKKDGVVQLNPEG